MWLGWGLERRGVEKGVHHDKPGRSHRQVQDTPNAREEGEVYTGSSCSA